LHSPITFSLAFSHSIPFQRYEFTNEIILIPVFLPPLLYPEFLISQLLSSLSLLSSFLAFSFSSFSLSSASFFLLFFISLVLFVFATPVFLALVSTTFYTPLNILLSSLLQSSNQSQDYSMQVIVFSRLHSASDPQLHQSLFHLYAPDNRYSLPLYTKLVPPCSRNYPCFLHIYIFQFSLAQTSAFL